MSDETPTPTVPDFGPGALDRAIELVHYLREHCPWDARQTPESLVPHLLEETHEVVDAIRAGDRKALEGELGDLLLNLAFQIAIAEEEGEMDRNSIAAGLEEKMIRRHPHLFGRGEEEDWETVKARERAEGDSALDGLPSGLDPLLRAHRIQERAAGVGFDWNDAAGAWEKAKEELEEVGRALEADDEAHLTEELGDLLFAVVNVVRLAGRHADPVLDEANRKFARRFRALERLAAERGLETRSATLEELDELWDEVKRGVATASETGSFDQ